MRDHYEIGQRVFSKAVGARSAFEGEVVARLHGSYHVKDENGDEWRRHPSELKLIKNATVSD